MSRPARILVISSQLDGHADAVLWALGRLDCEVDFWDIADFPASCKACISANDGKITTQLSGSGVSFGAPYDTVWLRRKGTPTHHPDTHVDDVPIVEREAERFVSNLMPWLGHESTLWVNHPDSDYRANSKLNQLVVAKQVGLRTPPTYMGNSPESVRSFFAEHDGRIVYKAFRSGGWGNPDGSNTALRTSRLSADHVQKDFAIGACPGIYQALVAKKFELRVTVFGGTVIATKIDSQKERETVDWRYDFRPGFEPFSPFELPAEIASRCLAMCGLLSITYAAFDFIVDEAGEYIFLELNPAGQFLFIEESVRSATLLDSFSRFLARLPTASSGPATVTMAEYFTSQSFKSYRDRELAFEKQKIRA